ncbi:MAG: lipid-A-disaccharide synthase [Planctomycetes bacterium]|nr:lipid-A-disaccharide synthase [Planctomycetota bacterium]
MRYPAAMVGGREVWIVAGEPSGDTHAAHLLAALARYAPDISFRGYGGPRMRDAGMDVLHDLASDAIMGVFPVVAALPRIRRLFRRAVTELRERRPAALVLVDYPGFNIRLAARAHAMGIPVIYYISPQVWAWARWRTKKLARICDLMLVILPFEAEVYRDSGLETVFVGHPLMDHLRTVDHDTDLIARLRKDVPEGAPVVGLFPGSRRSVVASLAPVFADAARRLRAREGTRDARIVVACAQERFRPLIESHLHGLDATVLVGKPYEVMEAADLALTSSGTTTLEIAAHGTPFVLGYRVSPVMYALGRMLVSVPHIGLVNLVAERSLVPEHIGVRSFARQAADDLHRLWIDPEARQTQVAGLAEVRDKLESEGSYDRAAAAIAGRLG